MASRISPAAIHHHLPPPILISWATRGQRGTGKVLGRRRVAVDEEATRKEVHLPIEEAANEALLLFVRVRDGGSAVERAILTTTGFVFGRSQYFRDEVAEADKVYLAEVPANTSARRLTKRGKLRAQSRSAKEVARSVPRSQWSIFHVRDGEKEPLIVRAISVPVATRRRSQGFVRETLLVVETINGAQRWYYLTNAAAGVDLAELVRHATQRHRIEEVFEEMKGEVGLDHFEVRSFIGWQHHMTLCQLAHWFLVRDRRRLGEKNAGPDGLARPRDPRARAAPTTHAHAGRALRPVPHRSQRNGPPGALPGTRLGRTHASSPHVRDIS